MKRKTSYQTQKIIIGKTKINMEFLEKNRFRGITFLGNGTVHNSYIDKVQKYDDYLKWAAKNIY